jgi:hypothetical protein
LNDFSFPADDCQKGSDRNLFTRLHDELFDNSTGEDFDLDIRFVCFNVRDDVTALDWVAHILAPTQELASTHVGAQLGHEKFSHGERSSPVRR